MARRYCAQLSKVLFSAACALAVASTAYGATPTPDVSFSTIATNGYGSGDVNSCAIDLNNLVTYGGYQFAAYYDTNQNLMIARRATGSSTWQTFSSGFSITDASDDHDVAALAIDSNGHLSVSWDMHNVTLNYAISTNSVLTPTLSAIDFNKLNATTAPTLFPSSGATTNEVTYPNFYHIPDSDDLLFAYRNGGAGGGSGNGNEYFDVYDPTTNTWTNSFVVNGEATSVNAYLNNLVYTSTGNLLMTWTWRETPNWQTNSNIMFAQSPDNGVTWYQQGQNGTQGTQYALPIIQSGTPSASVGQVIKNIPINDSFINQTSMAVDTQNRPMVASYWSPGWIPKYTSLADPSQYGNGAGTGNPNRQYMLEYYTGTQWETSQITDRTSDTSIDTSGNDVRDLGRPIVLVDKENRILVVTRSEDNGMGTAANGSEPGNDIVVYYTTDSMAAADGGTLPTSLTWQSITLDDANMGEWEPTYDSAAWAATNTLDLFYEPVGLDGESSGNVSVLEWDEQAFFGEPSAPTPEPASLGLLGAGALALLRRRR